MNLNNINKILDSLNSNKKTSTFAETIAHIFKDKKIEIYLGDQHEQLQKSDSTILINQSILGTVIGAHGDCLIINSLFYKNNKIHDGNIIFVNGYNIKAISELDNNGSMYDTFNSVAKI